MQSRRRKCWTYKKLVIKMEGLIITSSNFRYQIPMMYFSFICQRKNARKKLIFPPKISLLSFFQKITTIQGAETARSKKPRMVENPQKHFSPFQPTGPYMDHLNKGHINFWSSKNF